MIIEKPSKFGFCYEKWRRRIAIIGIVQGYLQLTLISKTRKVKGSKRWVVGSPNLRDKAKSPPSLGNSWINLKNLHLPILPSGKQPHNYGKIHHVSWELTQIARATPRQGRYRWSVVDAGTTGSQAGKGPQSYG